MVCYLLSVLLLACVIIPASTTIRETTTECFKRIHGNVEWGKGLAEKAKTKAEEQLENLKLSSPAGKKVSTQTKRKWTCVYITNYKIGEICGNYETKKSSEIATYKDRVGCETASDGAVIYACCFYTVPASVDAVAPQGNCFKRIHTGLKWGRGLATWAGKQARRILKPTALDGTRVGVSERPVRHGICVVSSNYTTDAIICENYRSIKSQEMQKYNDRVGCKIASGVKATAACCVYTVPLDHVEYKLHDNLIV